MITKDEFQDILDEETVMIFGVNFGHGRIVRDVDPLLFDVLYNDYIQSIEEAMEEENA